MSDLIKQLRHESDIFRKGGANGRADLIGNAADLIEKLQIERDALAAHVERVNDAIQQLTFEIAHDPSEIDFKSFGLVMDVMHESPATSLADRKEQMAEVARKAFEAGYIRGYGYDDDNQSEKFANEYASQLKRGE